MHEISGSSSCGGILYKIDGGDFGMCKHSAVCVFVCATYFISPGY